jgi:hypothetical protein
MSYMWWGPGGLVPNTRLEENVGGWKLHARWAPSVVSLFSPRRSLNGGFCFFESHIGAGAKAAGRTDHTA